MIDLNFHTQKKDLISSNIFTRGIFKIKCLHYFPSSNMNYFIFFQAFLNIIFVFVPIIFQNLYDENFLNIKFIQVYNLVCIFCELFILFILRKNMKKKEIEEAIYYQRVNVSFSLNLFLEVFFTLKIFLDFLIFLCHKNTEVKFPKAEVYREFFFEFFNKFHIFLLTFNANCFNLYKINLSKKIPLKLSNLILTMIFLVVSIFLLVIYFTKEEEIFKNKFYELIICESYLIIYLIYVYWIVKFKTKIFEIKNFLKRKLLNLKSLVDFLQNYIEENYQEGFLSFQIKVNKINNKNTKGKKNILKIKRKNNELQNNLKIFNEMEHTKISINSRVELLETGNDKKYSTTNKSQNIYLDPNKFSKTFNFNYENNLFLQKLKNEMIVKYNKLYKRTPKNKNDIDDEIDILENKYIDPTNQEENIKEKKNEINIYENHNSKRFERNLSKNPYNLNYAKIINKRQANNIKNNINDINISSGLDRENNYIFPGFHSSSIKEVLNTSLINIKTLNSKKSSNLIKLISKEFSIENESINSNQNKNIKSSLSLVDTVRIDNIINFNKQLYLKYQNKNIAFNDEFDIMKIKNSEILNDHNLNKDQINNYNDSKYILNDEEEISKGSNINSLISSKEGKNIDKNIFKYYKIIECDNLKRSSSNPTINSWEKHNRLYSIKESSENESQIIPINKINSNIKNLYSYKTNNIFKKKLETGKNITLNSGEDFKHKSILEDSMNKYNKIIEVEGSRKKSKSCNKLNNLLKNKNKLIQSNNLNNIPINDSRFLSFIYNNQNKENLKNHNFDSNQKKINFLENEEKNVEKKSDGNNVYFPKNSNIHYEDESYRSSKNTPKEDFRFSNFYLNRCNDNNLNSLNSNSFTDSSYYCDSKNYDEKINQIEFNKSFNKNPFYYESLNNKINGNIILNQQSNQESLNKLNVKNKENESSKSNPINLQITKELSIGNINSKLKNNMSNDNPNKIINELKTFSNKNNNINEIESKSYLSEKNIALRRKSILENFEKKDLKHSSSYNYNFTKNKNESSSNFNEKDLSDENKSIYSMNFFTNSSGEYSSNRNRTIVGKLNVSKNKLTEDTENENCKNSQNLDTLNNEHNKTIKPKTIKILKDGETSVSLFKKIADQNHENKSHDSIEILNQKTNKTNIEDLDEIVFKKKKIKDKKFSSNNINIQLNRSSSCYLGRKNIMDVPTFEKKSFNNVKSRQINYDVEKSKNPNHLVQLRKFSKSYKNEENPYFGSILNEEERNIHRSFPKNKSLLIKEENYHLPYQKKKLNKNLSRKFKKNCINLNIGKNKNNTHLISKPFLYKKINNFENFELLICYDISEYGNLKKNFRILNKFPEKDKDLVEIQSNIPRFSMNEKINTEIIALFKKYKFFSLRKFIEKLLLIFDNKEDFDYLTSIGPFDLILIDLKQIIPKNFKFKKETFQSNNNSENRQSDYVSQTIKNHHIFENVDILNSLMENESYNYIMVSKKINISTLKILDDYTIQENIDTDNAFRTKTKDTAFNIFSEKNS